MFRDTISESLLAYCIIINLNMSETLGKLLSSRRLKQGLTVEEVSERTRINAKFIRAAEADKFDQFPGVVFVRGFLRTYAELLELDGEEIVARYESLNIKEKDRSPDLISMPLHEKPAIGGPAIILIFFLLAAAVWFLYYLKSDDSYLLNADIKLPSLEAPAEKKVTRREPARTDLQQDQRQEVTMEEPEPEKSEAKPAVEKPPEKTGQEEDEAPGADTAEEEAPAPALEEQAAPQVSAAAEEGIKDTSRPYSLAISALSDTWIKAVIDGEVTREIILREGNTVTWWAERGYTVSIGNVAGTKIFLNGQEVPLGQPTSNVITNLMLPRPETAAGNEDAIITEQKEENERKPEGTRE